MSYVLSSTIATIPYQILAYYPFWNGSLRFSRRRTLFILLLVLLIKCACFYFLVPQIVSARLLEISFGLVHLSVYLQMMKQHPGTILFVYFFLQEAFLFFFPGSFYSLAR